jgi:copper chaperone CopZ
MRGESMEFNVDGMSCKNCVRHVTEALGELDDKAVIDVNLETGRVKFETQKEIDFEEIRKIIEEYGYTARA